MEADLQEVYGVELGGIFTGALTWRRLRVLLDGLPATSRLNRARDVRNTWAVGDYLAAQVADTVSLVADELAALRWTYLSANRAKGKPAPKRPKPYPRLPRPGDDSPKTVRRDPAPRRVRPRDAARRLAVVRPGVVAAVGGEGR